MFYWITGNNRDSFVCKVLSGLLLLGERCCRKLGVLVVVLLLSVAAEFCMGAENDWFRYLGNYSPPKAPRKGMNAAEALAPLPLPATPLRRTERKKPPQPDYLIGKVIWGKAASFSDSNGHKMEIADWNLCPSDAEKFVADARAMDLNYHWCNVNLADFKYDPQELPSLLFSGVRTIHLDKASIKRLRGYVLAGGTIVFDSIAGSPYFYKSAKELTAAMFPEYTLRVIPADHPIYHIFVDINTVNYPRNNNSHKPFLEGLYIGSRIGVLISRYGLGCGWNRNLDQLQKLPKATYYDIKSANQIGINIAAYIVGYAQAGLVEGKPELFGLADKKIPTDEFVFAQIKHGGAWNVHPGAATALLMKLRRYTSVSVNLQRRAVEPAKNDLSGYPFLYMAGLDDFTFSQKQVEALRHYLYNGGFLLINNGLGLTSFDKAVRRELGKLLPGTKLQVLPAEHGVYHSLFDIKQVSYSPVLQKTHAELGGKPYLLGININGQLAVLYSPYDLEAGWLNANYPLMRGYQASSARKLGMNIIMYVITH